MVDTRTEYIIKLVKALVGGKDVVFQTGDVKYQILSIDDLTDHINCISSGIDLDKYLQVENINVQENSLDFYSDDCLKNEQLNKFFIDDIKIGEICKFWNDDASTYVIDFLSPTAFYAGGGVVTYTSRSHGNFSHCIRYQQKKKEV